MQVFFSVISLKNKEKMTKVNDKCLFFGNTKPLKRGRIKGFAAMHHITSRFTGELWLESIVRVSSVHHITSRFTGELWLIRPYWLDRLHHITSRFTGELWHYALFYTSLIIISHQDLQGNYGVSFRKKFRLNIISHQDLQGNYGDDFEIIGYDPIISHQDLQGNYGLVSYNPI